MGKNDEKKLHSKQHRVMAKPSGKSVVVSALTNAQYGITFER